MVNIDEKEFRCHICNRKLPFRVVASMLNRLNPDRTGVCPNCATLLRYYTGNIKFFGMIMGLGVTAVLLCYYAYRVTGDIIYDAIGLFSFLVHSQPASLNTWYMGGLRAVGSGEPKWTTFVC